MKNLDKHLINKNFSKQALDYEKYALVQKFSVSQLINKLSSNIDLINFNNKKILDLGSGTSLIAKEFLKYNNCQNNIFYELDLSLEMLNFVKNRNQNFTAIQGDIANLPFKNNKFDLIISSFSFHWLENYQEIFDSFFSILKPDGILAFCLPVLGSCQNLKDLNLFQINDFPNPLTIKNSLENSGFKSISSHQENYLDNFINALDAVKYFKNIGANYSFNHKNLNENNYSNIRKFYKKNLLNYGENFKIDWNIYFFFCQKYV
jgi:malonyl-CoA O-methyltransferase